MGAIAIAEHGLAVADVLLARGGHLLDWEVEVEVEVDHRIDKVRRVVSDAVLHRDSRGAEAEFLDLDRFTMSVSRLAAKLWMYEAYSKTTFHEGERGAIGTTKYVRRERCRRSRAFPVIRLVLGGAGGTALERRAEALRQQVHGIELRIDVALADDAAAAASQRVGVRGDRAERQPGHGPLDRVTGLSGVR